MAKKSTEADVKATLAAFRRLPKEATKSLRERTLELAGTLADKVESAARSEGRQATLVAGSVKARKDRIPTIQAGGAKRVGRNRVPLHKVLFGAEFGSNRLPQFEPHRGKLGYFMFPTVEREKATIGRAWERVADDVVRDFTKGG